MRKIENSEIKKIELEILLWFMAFCKKYNLRFYLAGGTLLGAIRHKGFIPWDDDIDVCMPRPDYEMLVLLTEKINCKYKLKAGTLKNFSAPFAKLVDVETVIENNYTDDDIDTNLWIDIFPVDGLPIDMTQVKTIYKVNDIYRRCLLLCGAKLGEGKTFFKKIAKYILKPLVNVLGVHYWSSRLERNVQKYNYENSDYVGIVTWGLYGAGERMLKSEFEEKTEVIFEGYKFPAFSCWDSYLNGLYGDYMQLPPEEKRKVHDMDVYRVGEN